MKLIALNGVARSGKDTAAAHIRSVCGGRMQRVGFADKLKFSGALALGFNPRNIEEAYSIAEKLKTSGTVVTTFQDGYYTSSGMIRSKTITGREFYQLYGTEAHRDVFGEDFWVDALLPQPMHHGGPYPLQQRFPGIDFVVICDLRFPNEAQRVLDLGGEVWRIDADERLSASADKHPSEQPLDDYLITRTIDNNGTPAQFEARVRAHFWSMSTRSFGC